MFVKYCIKTCLFNCFFNPCYNKEKEEKIGVLWQSMFLVSPFFFPFLLPLSFHSLSPFHYIFPSIKKPNFFLIPHKLLFLSSKDEIGHTSLVKSKMDEPDNRRYYSKSLKSRVLQQACMMQKTRRPTWSSHGPGQPEPNPGPIRFGRCLDM